MGGEGANDVAFLLPSPPSRWNAIDDVRVTHLIICRIPALTIQKGGKWNGSVNHRKEESRIGASHSIECSTLESANWKSKDEAIQAHLSSLKKKQTISRYGPN